MSSKGNFSKRLHRDAEGAEVAHILRVCPLQGKHLLEIGCGEGFLTWQLASHAARITAIDPNEERLRQAQAARPSGSPAAHFVQARAEDLPFLPGTYDAVIFAHSL